jgi:hypothetical protein
LEGLAKPFQTLLKIDWIIKSSYISYSQGLHKSLLNSEEAHREMITKNKDGLNASLDSEEAHRETILMTKDGLITSTIRKRLSCTSKT